MLLFCAGLFNDSEDSILINHRRFRFRFRLVWNMVILGPTLLDYNDLSKYPTYSIGYRDKAAAVKKDVRPGSYDTDSYEFARVRLS